MCYAVGSTEQALPNQAPLTSVHCHQPNWRPITGAPTYPRAAFSAKQRYPNATAETEEKAVIGEVGIGTSGDQDQKSLSPHGRRPPKNSP